MPGESGKRLWEALEDLHRFVEGGSAEASFDEVLNALVDQSAIAKSYDGTGRAYDRYISAKAFQVKYRKANSG